ncbi:nitrite/sulfite reductase [Clostridium thailandense]|nr:nitrite/sulfite reductase [Clostridium thailandense]
MIEITEQILKSMENFKENLQKYKESKLEAFKPFGASMGIYEERLTETYMVRPRIPGGVITLEQLKAISEIAKKYAKSKIHFTSRQDIQFHSVEIDDLNNVLEDLIKAQLTTMGAGGNTVRNVGCSPLSGVAKDDVFDVTPYVKIVTNHLISDPTNMNLPRKFKVAFSNSAEDTGNATISDLGFIAKIVDGKKGFEVYGGGGLGGSARAALKLSDFIEANEVLYYVQAMKEVFENEGDRNNRHKARLRFVVHRLGEEDFVELFRKQLSKVKNEKKLNINIDLEQEEKESIKSSDISTDKKYDNIVFPEKQSGYYSLYVHPQNGDISTDNLDNIINYLTNLEYEASIRLTLTQGMFIRDLKEKDIQDLLQVTSKFSSNFDFDNSITCAGPRICKLGICNSQGLLIHIKETFEKVKEELKVELPRIFISGCPNSCGQHQKGSIGFCGKAKRTEDGLVPTYSVFFGGKVGADIVKLGQAYGDIPAKKISEFLLELAVLKRNSFYESFEEFIENKPSEIKELMTKYTVFESFGENPDLYCDFGSEDKFSVGK